MSSGVIAASSVVTPDEVLGPSLVDVVDGRIAGIRQAQHRVPDRCLAPGFVDLQVNGHDDVDVSRAGGDDWSRLDRLLLQQGVTAFCPALVSAPLSDYDAPLRRIAARAARAGGPKVLGVHLEGPFLSRPGAHPAWACTAPDLGWLRALPELVRIVTLAPELPGGLEAVAQLVADGRVVSIGHTESDAVHVIAAAQRGARLVTHLFNVMPAMDRRSPGPVGAALADQRLVPFVIADGVHVDPLLLRVVARAKGRGGWGLVTDAVAWRAGGTSTMPVTLVDGAPRTPTGRLAGSAARMDACLRTCVDAGVPLVDAVRAAATTPADVLGERDRGRITPGARADLVALDRDLRVTTVWLSGDEQDWISNDN